MALPSLPLVVHFGAFCCPSVNIQKGEPRSALKCPCLGMVELIPEIGNELTR